MLHKVTVYVHFLSLTGSVLSSNWTDSVRQVSRRKEYEFEKVSCLKVKVDVQNTHRENNKLVVKILEYVNVPAQIAGDLAYKCIRFSNVSNYYDVRSK